MKFDKETNQALKIILVFAVNICFFKLVEKLSPFIFIGIDKGRFKNFIEVYLFWFIVMILIIVGICMCIRKAEGKFNFTFIHNPRIRLTSGLLITFAGVFNLSIDFPVALLNIKTFHLVTSGFENTFGTSRVTLMISNIIPSLTNLLQVLFGLYFILHKINNKEIENLD